MSRDDPLILEAQLHVMKLAKSKGVSYMNTAMNAEALEKWLERDKDLRMFFVGPESTQFMIALHNLILRSREVAVKYMKVRGRVGSRQGRLSLQWST